MNDFERKIQLAETLPEMISVDPDEGFSPAISDRFLERYGEDSVFVTATVDFLNHRFNQLLVNAKRISEDHEAVQYGDLEMRACLEHLLQVLRNQGMDKGIVLLMRSATGYEQPEAFLIAAGSLLGESLVSKWIKLLEIEDYKGAASLLEAH